MNSVIDRFFRDRPWRENNVAAYASIGVLVFITCFFWGATRDFMQVVYGLSFFAPVLFVLALRKPDFREYGGWFTGLALIYGTYAAASTLWSPAPRLLFFGYHLLFLAVWLCGAAWLASRNQLNIERIYRAMVVVGAIASVVNLAVFYYSHPLTARLFPTHWGVLRHPNGLGFIFSVTFAMAYLLWLRSRGFKQGLLWLGLMCLNLLPVLASQSRGAWLAFAITMTVAFILGPKSPTKLAAHALLAVLIGLLIYSQWDFVGKILNSRINAPTYREQLWPYMIDTTVKEQLLFGEGLVKTSRISPPGSTLGRPFEHGHNAYIDAFYRTGLVGLVLMLLHLGYVLRHWTRDPRLLPLFLWILFACIFSLFDNPGFFWYLEFMWLVYWIPAGLIGALVMAEKAKKQAATTG